MENLFAFEIYSTVVKQHCEY